MVLEHPAPRLVVVYSHGRHDTRAKVLRQSVGKGCQKSIFPWALWLSKVICVFSDAFEEIYPLHDSGVVQGYLAHQTPPPPRTLQ